MRKDYFNPDTYMVIDRITGEEVNVKIFIEQCNGEYWEMAYAKTIADYIGVGGKGSSEVLAYILKEKTANNQLLGTVREIAEALKVSPTTVSGIFNKLRKKDFIKRIRSGCYFVSPHLIRHGSKTKGAMLLRLWDET